MRTPEKGVSHSKYSEGPAKHQYRQEAKADAFYMGVYHKGLFFFNHCFKIIYCIVVYSCCCNIDLLLIRFTVKVKSLF